MMPPNRMKQIPAICILASLVILCGWHLSSADESKDKSSLFGLSDLFSSISSNGGSTTITTNNGQSLSLSSEQLNSLLEQIHPQKKPHEGDQTRSNHGHSRRKLLYDLSVKAHYGNLVRQNDINNSSDTQQIQEEVMRCVYYNEGLNAVPIKDIKGGGDGKNILSRLSYWTFKICPQHSIQQVHLLPVTKTSNGEESMNVVDTTVENDVVEVLKLPPDSVFSKNIQFLQVNSVHLGTYVASSSDDKFYSKIKKAWGEDEVDMHISSTEYYFDGNFCRYTPEGLTTSMMKQRRSKVVYQNGCCKRVAKTSDQFFHQKDDLMILSINEPLTCQYIVKVCRVCPDDKAQNTKSTSPQITNDETLLSSVNPSGFVHLMKTYLHHTLESESIGDHSDHYNPPAAFPPMPPSQIEANKRLLHKMFTHAYDSYMYNAFPASELHPISCTAGTFHLVRIPALTLIDTLDTLIIMRNFTEFARSVERIRYLDDKMRAEYKYDKKNRKVERGGLFSVDQNVSLFETTIRVLGGLLSAHQLALAFMHGVVPQSDVWDSAGEVLWGYNDNVAKEPDFDDNARRVGLMDDSVLRLSPSRPCIPRKESNNSMTPVSNQDCWTYDGLLLTLAHDIGKRLVLAFDTDTGIPFGTVNLLRGVPPGETEIASLAGAGTLTLEFELLSRLTGDPTFGKAAKRATRSLWLKRTRGLDLFGKHINVKSGKWTETLSGIGSNSDSFYEYLVKHYVLFPDDADFWIMFVAAYAGVQKNSRIGDWYVDVDMNRGLQGNVRQTFESLMAFYPGMQTLIGELSPAAKTLSSFFLVREFVGLLPERFDFVHWRTEGTGDIHPLRPELLESAYFLHLATLGLYGSDNGPCSDSSKSHRTSNWLWAADFALHAVMRLSWVPCGFATVKKIGPKTTGSLDFVNGFSDNPHIEQKKHNVQHHNEMPSFFLSETIKYLYLLFDSEDNILHQDSDREWIFTTEAHPIHHVPASSTFSDGAVTEQSNRISTEGTNLEDQMNKIRLLLKQELQLSLNETTLNKNWNPTDQKVLPQILLDDLEFSQNTTTANKWSAFELYGLKKGPTFHIELPQDLTHLSDISAPNYAHHRIHRGGSGINIGRRCPNYHNSRLAWPLALHGHTIDYNVAHKSSASDYYDNDSKVDIHMQSALASTVFYGTDYYIDGINIDKDRVCQNDKSKPPTTDGKSKNKVQETNYVIPGAVRYDMGGNLGLFDVSAFTNGDGFVVRHVASGELLEVSMFSNEIPSGGIAVLVSLTTPSETISSYVDIKQNNLQHLTTLKKSENLKTLKEKNEEPKQHERSDIIDYEIPEKTVVIGDMNGHSYHCEVVINENDRVLAHFPCSPGFFGKAHISNLIQSDGVSVTGQLRTPPIGDTLGCDPPSKESEVNANNFCLHNYNQPFIIQIVYRGECNFASKTLNQVLERNAAAVIVINSNPVELFCMAGDKEATTSVEGCSQMDLPPSVLITGHDGDWLLDLIDHEKIDLSSLTATVKISKAEDEFITFPYVKGSDNTLQVLASKGWGAQAVRQDITDSTSDGTSAGWQLFITAHEYGKA